MKNKKYLILLLLLPFFLSFSKPDNTTINGYIKIFSNEPFTFVGIETDDGKQYTLISNEENITKLRELQGKKITLNGRIYKEDSTIYLYNQQLKDGYFELLSWKVHE